MSPFSPRGLLLFCAALLCGAGPVNAQAPYRQYVNKLCTTFTCQATFPFVPNGYRLEIENVACSARTNYTTEKGARAHLSVASSTGSSSQHALLPVAVLTDVGNQYYAMNASMFVPVPAGFRPSIFIAFPAGTNTQIDCGITGRLIRLG